MAASAFDQEFLKICLAPIASFGRLRGPWGKPWASFGPTLSPIDVLWGAIRVSLHVLWTLFGPI